MKKDIVSYPSLAYFDYILRHIVNKLTRWIHNVIQQMINKFSNPEWNLSLDNSAHTRWNNE